MADAGYEYKAGKQPAFKGLGQKKFTRLRSLKEGYSEGDILAVIVGEKQLSPERKKANNIQSQTCGGKRSRICKVGAGI